MSNLAYKDEDIKYEKIYGKIVSMSPRPSLNHYNTVHSIHIVFKKFLKGKGCKVFVDGLDVFFEEEDTVVVPDVMVVCNNDIIKKDGIHGVPDLVVEVLSPSSIKHDRIIKKDLYSRCGVREYWIVDAESSYIEVYLQKDNELTIDNIYTYYTDRQLERMTDEQKGNVVSDFSPSLFPDLKISLQEIFSPEE